MSSNDFARSNRRLNSLAVTAVAALSVSLVPAVASAAPSAGEQTTATTAAAVASYTDVTDPAEAARVDAVDVSSIAWGACDGDDSGAIECASLDVPMDYDAPDGEKYTLSIVRRPANNADEKIGSLFVNPGGPGASAVGTVSAISPSQALFSPEIFNRFDVIGVDPRGVGGSHIAKCFDSVEDYQAVEKVFEGVNYPMSYQEITDFAFANAELAKACTREKNTIFRHMSTAEHARDIDVVRRAVGDEKTTFIGFSYGTHVSQVYANMFPDRTRAVVADSVIDSFDYAGLNNRDTIQDIRLWSGRGTEEAVWEVVRLCEAAGEKCPGGAGFEARFTTVVDALKKAPIDVTMTDPDSGESQVVSFRLDRFTVMMQNFMYRPSGPENVAKLVNMLHAAHTAGDEAAGAAAAQMFLEERAKSEAQFTAKDAEYSNWRDLLLGVACSDGRHPRSVGAASMQADRIKDREPLMGRTWSWNTVACAEDVWKADDADAYFGNFGKKTNAPILFVNNRWDIATYYRQAITAARRHPGAGLVLTNGWGHISYNKSTCARAAVDSYLLTGKHDGQVQCDDTPQPFSAEARALSASSADHLLTTPRQPLR